MRRAIKLLAVTGFVALGLTGCSDNGRYQLVLGPNGTLIRLDTKNGGMDYMTVDPKSGELIPLPEHRRRYPQ